MTYSYNISDDVGRIRLIIQDKDITNAFFTDEEITYFLTTEGSINLAAAAALEAWAAAYATNADSEGIGDYRYSQTITDKMIKLAQRLRDGEAGVPAMSWAEMDLADTAGTEEDA